MTKGIYTRKTRKDNGIYLKCDNCENIIRKYPSIIHNTNFCSIKCKKDYGKRHLNKGIYKKGEKNKSITPRIMSIK